MHTVTLKWLSARLFTVAFAAALSLLPHASQGQTYFASGSNTNAATSANNLGFGYQTLNSLTSGSYNIANGYQALYSNTTGIGNMANSSYSLYINANGQLGTLTSSARFKFDIKSLGEKSDRLMDLRPVSFRYKEATAEGDHPIQYGLIAEEVAKVYPDMVQYDKEGKPFTVYYQQLTPMMLNELQKSHQDIAALKSEVAELKLLVQKQSASAAETPNRSQPVLFSAAVLAACMTGALWVISRNRPSL